MTAVFSESPVRMSGTIPETSAAFFITVPVRAFRTKVPFTAVVPAKRYFPFAENEIETIEFANFLENFFA